MPVSRRSLLQASAVALGFAGLRNLVHGSGGGSPPTELPADPRKLFDLPEGFSYRVVSETGQTMDDGFLVPGKADGMCAFPGPEGKTLLVRNHELMHTDTATGPFGKKNELLSRVDPALLFDGGSGTRPCLGGTTTILFDTRTGKTERQFLSLVGTLRNCAGGPTPWNSWITCEENVQRAKGTFERDHGYNFEVPARAKMELTRPVALKAMGRFNHEAVAVDPRTGIVYQTEDREDGLLYRFIPQRKGDLAAGGRLQALRAIEKPRLDTRNWDEGDLIAPGTSFGVEWVDVEDVESPEDDLRLRGFNDQGCVRFARGEGMWYGREAVYFATTTGGTKRRGQIWRYAPSPAEGTEGEGKSPGKLELFVEPNDSNVAENADNLTIAPWGDVFICEDHSGKNATPEQRLLRITPAGEVSAFGRNALNSSELAGVTFSPDGSTLFVNMYNPGITLAITGPWGKPIPKLG